MRHTHSTHEKHENKWIQTYSVTYFDVYNVQFPIAAIILFVYFCSPVIVLIATSANLIPI